MQVVRDVPLSSDMSTSPLKSPFAADFRNFSHPPPTPCQTPPPPPPPPPRNTILAQTAKLAPVWGFWVFRPPHPLTQHPGKIVYIPRFAYA